MWGHLGGTAKGGDEHSWCPELWMQLLSELPSNGRVLDVGCGVGYSQRFFHEAGFETIGMDCEQMRSHHLLPLKFTAHDLTTGPWLSETPFDLVWCCEVVEHVFESRVQNVIDTLVKNCCGTLAMTAAPVGADGCHHVNCQNPPYWINKIEAAGLLYQKELTERLRKLPGLYFQRTGMVFKRPIK